MDLLIIAMLSLVMGVVLLCMGLSFLDQSLQPFKYTNDAWQGNKTANDYYSNPLWGHDSKWFHYRPKGSVIVSKKQWGKIEKDIGLKIIEEYKLGVKKGRAGLLVEIVDELKEQKATTRLSPYVTLGTDPATPLVEIEEKYKLLLEMYDPSSFRDLHKSFTELAEIRIAEIKRAWQLVNTGIGAKTQSLSGGNF
jgi:hypothetical protein